MGVSVSTQNINTESEDTSWKSAISLKYGQQSQDWRTIFTLDYTQDSYFGGQVEIDNILLDDMFGTAKLRPYFGAVAGYMAFDDKNLNLSYEETNGFYYGANFGFIVYASDNIDIDLSYHYYSVQNLDFLDDLHGATLAIHYFF
ncbi:MAG: hypothetical protein Q9M39_02565 [Sulfurovum sp.]|nr:hypothetical protein [Sulfurovum sp.]